MRFVFLSNPRAPLPDAACLIALTDIAAAAGVSVPEDAVVVVRDDAWPGTQYPVAVAYDAAGQATYFVDEGALRRAIAMRGDAEIAAAGMNPAAPDFGTRSMRLLRRRFAHWPEERIAEIAALLPAIAELAVSSYDFDDE